MSRHRREDWAFSEDHSHVPSQSYMGWLRQEQGSCLMKLTYDIISEGVFLST